MSLTRRVALCPSGLNRKREGTLQKIFECARRGARVRFPTIETTKVSHMQRVTKKCEIREGAKCWHPERDLNGGRTALFFLGEGEKRVTRHVVLGTPKRTRRIALSARAESREDSSRVRAAFSHRARPTPRVAPGHARRPALPRLVTSEGVHRIGTPRA